MWLSLHAAPEGPSIGGGDGLRPGRHDGELGEDDVRLTEVTGHYRVETGPGTSPSRPVASAFVTSKGVMMVEGGVSKVELGSVMSEGGGGGGGVRQVAAVDRVWDTRVGGCARKVAVVVHVWGGGGSSSGARLVAAAMPVLLLLFSTFWAVVHVWGGGGGGRLGHCQSFPCWHSHRSR